MTRTIIASAIGDTRLRLQMTEVAVPRALFQINVHVDAT
jgi:hypothetical protein